MQEITKKISVVIPAYNARSFIRDTVDSVLAQSYGNMEIVIVDDCSTDGTREAIADYIDGKKVRYILRDNNGGIAAGRNTGLRACTGELIAMLDHDDLWEREKLEKQAAFLKNGGYGAVFTNFYMAGRDGVKKEFPQKKKAGTEVLDGLLTDNIILNSSIMFKREVLDIAGFVDEAFIYCEDWDWWIRMAMKVKIGFMPEYLVVKRDVSSSFSNVYKGKFMYYLKLYDKHAVSLDVRQRAVFKGSIARRCFLDAQKLLRAGRLKLGLESYMEAVKKQFFLILKFPNLIKKVMKEQKT